MTVIQAQLIAGLIITCAMLIPSLVALIKDVLAKRAEKRGLRECTEMWLAMEQDLYGNDPVDVDYDALVDVDLDNTCEFDCNYQG